VRLNGGDELVIIEGASLADSPGQTLASVVMDFSLEDIAKCLSVDSFAGARTTKYHDNNVPRPQPHTSSEPKIRKTADGQATQRSELVMTINQQ
jgi:hypothetical protein